MADAPDMFHNWASDDEVTRFMTWRSHADISLSELVISNWLTELRSSDCYRWCIAHRETGQVIGAIDVVRLHKTTECAEIGYCLSRRYWNQGIMSEALYAVIEFLFSSVECNRIEACHHVGNPASGKVMQKCGMRFEGIKRQGGLDQNGNFYDLANYAILWSDWAKKKSTPD